MSLALPVLVRGINNLSDARYCAGMGATGLIFTLDPALPGAVAPAAVRELAGWVAGVDILGEVGVLPDADLLRLVDECELGGVLLRHEPTRSAWPLGLPVPVLVEVPNVVIINQDHYDTLRIECATAFPAGFALVCNAPHTYPPDLAYWHGLTRQAPIWLAAPPTADDARLLTQHVQPAGLLLSGGDELKPGLRDFTDLEEVFEALEAEE